MVKEMNIDAFIKDMPMGFETCRCELSVRCRVIGERGSGISGGQKQVIV